MSAAQTRKTSETSADARLADAESALPRIVRRVPMAILLLITGAIGWGASWTLVIEKLDKLQNPGHATICDFSVWVSCGSVMETAQSSAFGFPNMFIGIVAFAIVITTAMAMLSGANFKRWYWVGFQVGVTLGFAFITWLWSQAVYDIRILCPLCMIVWAIMIPMFVWTTIRNVVHGVIPAPAGLRKHIADYGWPLVALLYVGVIASILIQFQSLIFGGVG